MVDGQDHIDDSADRTVHQQAGPVAFGDQYSLYFTYSMHHTLHGLARVTQRIVGRVDSKGVLFK
jgi:hypothetical protein